MRAYGGRSPFLAPSILVGVGLGLRDELIAADGLPEPAGLFTPEQLWIEHCAARNVALAERARKLGNHPLAARLDEESRSEERHVEQILEMLDGLDAGDTPTGPGR